MTSNLTKAGVAVGLSYLLWRVVRAAGLLLFYVVKMAVLLPIVLFNLCNGGLTVKVNPPPPPEPARRQAPAPISVAAKPAAVVPDLGPASVPSTGDWRQDRETLKRLLAEGQIK